MKKINALLLAAPSQCGTPDCSSAKDMILACSKEVYRGRNNDKLGNSPNKSKGDKTNSFSNSVTQIKQQPEVVISPKIMKSTITDPVSKGIRTIDHLYTDLTAKDRKGEELSTKKGMQPSP